MRSHLFPRATRGQPISTVIVGSTAAILLALLSGVGARIRLNLSASIPIGLYREEGDANRLKRGDIVLACLPSGISQLAQSRGYVPHGGKCVNSLAPVGKRVMALPGDTVLVTSTGLIVNGVPVPNSRTLKHDGAGRLLPSVSTGTYVTKAGSVWLIGTSGQSFDSRYFGPVSVTDVLSRVRPL